MMPMKFSPRMLRQIACLAVVSMLILLKCAVAIGDELEATVDRARPRIDPDGIKGALIVAGDHPPEEALDRFFELADSDAKRLVIIRFGESESSRNQAIDMIRRGDARNVASIHLMCFDSIDRSNRDALSDSLRDATGAWVVGDSVGTLRERIVGTPWASEIRTLVERGGVLGGNQACSKLIAASIASDDENDKRGLEILPDSIIDFIESDSESSSRFPTSLQSENSLVGYELNDDTALIVRGRRLRAVGPSAVNIHLAASNRRPARKVALQGHQRIADLTALRRSAMERVGDAFPPAEPAPPTVENGTLIIVGGGLPKGLAERFVELAGGKEASIVVLPTAVPDPIGGRNRMANTFRRAGAKTVTVLPGRRRSEVESDEYLDAFRNATGIWFGGGRQWRFVDAYQETEAEKLMHDLLRRGGVIMGSSAGASIQAEYMVRGNPLGNLDIMAEGYERGLGFLSGVAVDQHFRERGRFQDMTSLVTRYPQLLGIGIDESTAIVVRKHIAEVTGRGGVHFYDKSKSAAEGDNDYETVKPGGAYDLVRRAVLDSGREPEE